MKIKMIINSKEEEIHIPSFSLTIMEEKLKKTVFSKRNIEFAERRIENNPEIKKGYNEWMENNNNELFKIHKHVQVKFFYEIPLYAVPYNTKDNSKVKIIYFVIIPDGGHWYVARLDGHKIIWYTGHCVERYAKRSLNYSSIISQATIVGKMLVNNFMLSIGTYTYKDEELIYGVGRDGIFFCLPFEDSLLKTTFIARKNFWPSQMKYYNNQLIGLNPKLLNIGEPPIQKIFIRPNYHRIA